ncbi:PorT family protein [Larkinella terrae]|uniref:PorT family protein n=1 Tax=Larkinella terrae TaxID=2025311 RepID=A0A7K0EQ44_9BACT|nr:PorT family protein [Larkinella terrae]MRS63953.1 PorT family protein [Larkinella terrae]
MKRSNTLLALCLLGTWSAFAQTISSDTTKTTTTTITTTGTDTTYRSNSANSTNSTMDNSSNTATTPTTTTNDSPTQTPSSTYSSTTTTEYSASRETRPKAERPYKAFTGGFYVGANTTRYRGEDVDGDNPAGRLGYQIGAFVRGGGRLYGQLGVEYFASSSNYFSPGDGSTIQDISGRINTKWLQIPAYIGVKLAQSERGISAVRLAVGAEYANRLSSSNTINIDNNEIKSGTFLGLANLGFDIGPVLIDLVYHYGFSDAISGFNNSQRRALGLNVGFKF